MKQYFLKVAGMAALALSLHFTGFTQDEKDSLAGRHRNNAEIIIKPKGDADITLKVEIRGGEVFINGKPADQFADDKVSVLMKKIMTLDGPALTIDGMDGMVDMDRVMGPDEPFHKGGGWSFNGENAKRAFLGVNSVKADENVEGAKVKEVTKGSAAEKAGLKTGDLIVKVDEIVISDPHDLSEAIHKYKPLDKVTLIYKRDGKEQKTTATLGKIEGATNFNYNYNFKMPRGEDNNFSMPPMPPMRFGDGPRAFSWNDGRPKLGIKAQDMEEGKGAKVLDVDDESPAGKAGIKEGDIITRFDGRDVDNASMLADLARESKEKSSIKISLTREGKTREIEVKVPRKLKTADL